MSKKRGKSIKININMSNRLLYTLILIGILIVVGIGVYAATYTASGAGHPYTEISTCGANQTLKMNAAGTAWTCGNRELDCQRVESSITTNPFVFCPSGYIVTGGGGWCQSMLDRLVNSQPSLSISPSASGWSASCNVGTTNNPAPTRAYAICCKS